MITVIGDVHGKFYDYHKIASSSEYSIQVGDFGFSDTWNKLLYSGFDPKNHKVISGNHDDYDQCPASPFYLGDYGPAILNKKEFFFVRGGLSIDRVYRIGEELSGGQKTWWSQEELNLKQMMDCLDMYKLMKPEIVISHVPAAQFTHVILGNKSDAVLQRYKFHKGFKEAHQLLGDEMLKIHKPKMWISGHMHSSFQGIVNGVQIVALNELETIYLE